MGLRQRRRCLGKRGFWNIKGKGPNLNQLKAKGYRIGPRIRLTTRKTVPIQFQKFSFKYPTPACDPNQAQSAFQAHAATQARDLVRGDLAAQARNLVRGDQAQMRNPRAQDDPTRGARDPRVLTL